MIPLVLVVVVLPTAWHGWPGTLAGNALIGCLLAGGLLLLWWRTHPRTVAVAGGGLWLAGAALAGHGWFPDPAFVLMALLSTVAALGFRSYWAAAGLAGYLVALFVVLHLAAGETNPVPLLMFGVPGFFAGTVLRLRRETADQLAERGRELAEERELFADLALRHERARIAAELHDIIGHAISVMIIQAAAGQRLVDRDPARAREAFAAIAESARQGRGDLGRLVDLLGSNIDAPAPVPHPAQPGLTPPGFAQTGLTQTGFAQPNLAQPGLTQPGLTPPDLTQTGLTSPDLTQPGLSQTGLTQTDSTQLGFAQPDFALIDEVVTRAARTGLAVSCRFEGVRDAVTAPVAHLAFRVVQESLTNALRHAPGSAVRVTVRGSPHDLAVCVENDPARAERPGLTGTGRGLTGLRERIQQLGGRLTAGPTEHGGWRVQASLPHPVSAPDKAVPS